MKAYPRLGLYGVMWVLGLYLCVINTWAFAHATMQLIGLYRMMLARLPGVGVLPGIMPALWSAVAHTVPEIIADFALVVFVGSAISRDTNTPIYQPRQ